MKRIALLWILAMLSMPAQADKAAQKVLDCMRANVPPNLRVRDVELASTDRTGGTRVLKGKLYAMREKGKGGRSLVRAMLRVNSPDNLAGAAYLVRQNDDYLSDGMFVYLPAVRRVRRVTGTFADGALLGTDFSYNDFKQLQNAFGGMTAKWEGPSEVDGRPSDVLLFKARPSEDSRYSAVRAWIDREACVPLQAEFYEADSLRKQLSTPAGSLRRAGDFWYLSEATMRDVKDLTHTVLKVVDAKGGELPGRYFDPTAFHLGN